MQTSLPTYDASMFGAFLVSPKRDSVDLSKATLLECIEEMCNVKSIMSPNFWRTYSSLKRQIRLVQETFGCELMPWQVNDVFWSHFVAFMMNKGNLSLSSVKVCCSQLRTVLAWASRHKCEISPTYDFIYIPTYCHQQISLTPDEVSHIYHYNINSIQRRKQYREHMERVRDAFCLTCNLGQRYSDMKRIDRSCFDRNIFTIVQQKTGGRARVDIETMSIDRNMTYKLLEKYDYKYPLQTDISCGDKYLHQLLHYIGDEFNDEVKQETRVNGVISEEFKPKWKLVTNHTGRRTFATVNILRGMPEAQVRRGTGHRSSSAFEKYICYFDD